MKRKITTILLLLCLSTSVLAGCSKTSSSINEQEETKKTFVFGDTTFNPENNEPDVNPHNDNSGWACIRYGIGETLFRYSDDMKLEPWLAKEYKLVDESTWEIVLKDDIYFTSGRLMDGESVKECIEGLIENHERAAGNLKIDTIVADEQRLTITTKIPVPAFLNYLSDPYGCVFDIQAGITEDGIVSATGPYKAVSLSSGDRIDLVKNENYWNGTPKIDEITVLTISDGDTLTMALQSGEIDGAYGMPYASYPIFENDDYTFSSVATSRVFFAWMNFESDIIKEPAIRKAIAMAIDKEGFVETLLNGNGYPAKGVFPSTFTFGNDAVTTETFDLEGAKQVLEDAGWIDIDGDGFREKNGEKLSIRWLTYPSRQELPLLAESVQATLKEIGIEVEINLTADHNSVKADTNSWDIYASAMITAPTGDPEYFFSYCCLDNSATNTGHYHNDKLEQLAQEMSKTFEVEDRNKLAVEMQQIILDDNAYVFCSHLRMSMISKSNVKGLVAHPCDFYEITVDLDIN